LRCVDDDESTRRAPTKGDHADRYEETLTVTALRPPRTVAIATGCPW